MVIKEGTVVKSIAGHDKGSFYVAVRLENEFAFIADGRRRKAEKPKKKKLRHLAATRRTLEHELYQTNQNIRRSLHSFNFECGFDSDEEVI